MPLTRNVISGWFAFGCLKCAGYRSVANDHLGPKSLISDSATRRSLWPLQCQPVALDDNEWQISKALVQSGIQTHGQVSKKSYFDIWHFWKSYCWLRLIWGLDHRSRSRSRRSRYILPGAGAGAGAVGQFYSESEPEPEPECFPGAGADQKCHGSASLVMIPIKCSLSSPLFLVRQCLTG